MQDRTQEANILFSLLNHMLKVLLVFANAFHQFHIWKEFEMNRRSPWPCVRLQIVDGDFYIHVTEVTAVESFGRVIDVTVRMASVIEPALIIEALRIDHECIVFPLANRITQPRWLHFLRKAAAICKNLTKVALVLKQDQGHGRSLENFKWGGRYQHGIRYAVR